MTRSVYLIILKGVSGKRRERQPLPNFQGAKQIKSKTVPENKSLRSCGTPYPMSLNLLYSMLSVASEPMACRYGGSTRTLTFL